MRVLNVGGGTGREIPRHYKGWEQHVLDIDPNVGAEIVCDAKEMRTLKAAQYDAIFCSHNLEHFYRHEVPTVLAGFRHVLKADGFAQIAVPDLMALVRDMTDPDAVWYRTGAGVPITFHDVLYGWDAVMSKGNLFYAHKCGFSRESLTRVLRKAGFAKVLTAVDGYNVHAFAFQQKPTKARLELLGL